MKRPRLNQKNQVERKQLTLTEGKLLTGDTPGFEGYGSTFGNVDLHGDIVVAGAFKKTISDNAGIFPLLSQHDYTKEIGLITAREDAHGLFVEGKFYTDDDGNLLELARDEYYKMKRRQEAGRPLQMSIGYRAINPKFKDGVRHLTEVALAEVSLVTFPANTEAVTTAVKTEDADPATASERLRKALDAIAERLKAREMEGKDFQGPFEDRARRFQAMSTLDAAIWTIGDVLEEAMWAWDEEIDARLADLPKDLSDFSTAAINAIHAYHGLSSKADRDETQHPTVEPREHSKSEAAGESPASEPGDHSLTQLAKNIHAFNLRLQADDIRRKAQELR